MNQGKESKTVVKFVSKKKYADDLCKGNLRFSTPKKFRDMEENEGERCRSDINEGLIEAVAKTEGYIEFDNEKIHVNIDDLKIYEDCQIFSMYMVKFDDETALMSPINSEVGNFGEWAVLIRNPANFISKIKFYGKRHQKLEMEANEVIYDGKPGLFHKSPEYSYQNEYRIIIRPKIKDEHFIMRIRNIEDICSVVKTEELPQKLKSRMIWTYEK